MIVVAIIAIVASIAFTAFSESGRDTQRMRAVSDLSALNDAVGRAYQTNFSYTGLDEDGALAALALASGITLTTDYNFAIDVSDDGQSYMLVAAPAAGSGQVGDGALVSDNTGRRCFHPGDDEADSTAVCPKSL